jgi:hypothetical protein
MIFLQLKEYEIEFINKNRAENFVDNQNFETVNKLYTD